MNRSYICFLCAPVLALASCKHEPHELSPLDVLELCKPGGSIDHCDENLSRTDEAFPAGRLEEVFLTDVDVDLSRDHVFGGGVPRDGAFWYSMKLEGDTADVEQLLRAELGAPLKANQAPPLPRGVLLGDLFWVTPDGLWTCECKPSFDGQRISWYSYAFHSSNPKGYFYGERRELDKYVYPAPLSAALWKKIGLLLVGSDVEPVRMRKKPGETR